MLIIISLYIITYIDIFTAMSYVLVFRARRGLGLLEERGDNGSLTRSPLHGGASGGRGGGE